MNSWKMRRVSERSSIDGNTMTWPTGIDMGGLFKDFWTELSASVFSAEVGLFRLTSDRLLYPNPSAKLLHPDDYLNLFEFLGTRLCMY
jgi:hypothetical protein